MRGALSGAIIAVGLACGCARDGIAPDETVTVVLERTFADGVACREQIAVAGGVIRAESCRTDPPTVIVIDPAHPRPEPEEAPLPEPPASPASDGSAAKYDAP